MKESPDRRHFVDPERVRTIYYGIDPEQFRPASAAERIDARRKLILPVDRPVVAFIGALGQDRRKGFDVLFDAWCQCSSRSIGTQALSSQGTGPELPYWKRRVAELGMENDIRVLGFTKEISTLLAAADLLVSPTRFEPYGQGVHEAICCGLPVFVTRCAGIAERFPAELHDLLLETLRMRRSFVSGYLIGTRTSTATGDERYPSRWSCADERGRTWRPTSSPRYARTSDDPAAGNSGNARTAAPVRERSRAMVLCLATGAGSPWSPDHRIRGVQRG